MSHRSRIFSRTEALLLVQDSKYAAEYTWLGQLQWSPERVISLLSKLGYLDLHWDTDGHFSHGRWTKLAGYEFKPSVQWLEQLLDQQSYKEIKPIKVKKSVA
jgi:hypothetical protein